MEKLEGNYDSGWLTDFGEMVKQRCWFDYWLLGHYHRNCVIDKRFVIQWEKIAELDYE